MKEKIFQYGVEGGGETLYKDEENGSIIFHTQGSSLSLDDNDEEQIKKWKRTYKNFEDFWNTYIKNEKWFWFYPVFIHPDVRDVVKKELEKLKDNPIYNAHAKYNWKRAVKIVTDEQHENRKNITKDLFD